jgi:hypothetical protein
MNQEHEETKPTKIYICGPVTGMENYNVEMFAWAADRLKAMGYDPVDPVVGTEGMEWVEALSRDLPILIQQDAVAVLPGPWYNSKGAKLELHVAQALEKKIYHIIRKGDALELHEGLPPDTGSAIEETHRLVYGARNETYGHPYEDYTKTAAFMSIILGTEVTPEQAILCMIAVKMSRELHNPKRDNRVDMAGYAECLQKCYNLTGEQKGEYRDSIYGTTSEAKRLLAETLVAAD